MAAHQAPPSLGFSRQEYWSGLPFPSPVHESEKWKWSRSVMSHSKRPHGLQPNQAPPSMGFSRQEYWSGVPLPSPTYGISQQIGWACSLPSKSLIRIRNGRGLGAWPLPFYRDLSRLLSSLHSFLDTLNNSSHITQRVWKWEREITGQISITWVWL